MVIYLICVQVVRCFIIVILYYYKQHWPLSFLFELVKCNILQNWLRGHHSITPGEGRAGVDNFIFYYMFI